MDRIRKSLPWSPEAINDIDKMPQGDMPGDKVIIEEKHIIKAQTIFPKLLDFIIPVLENNPYQKAVVSVCGGSGVGKSEVASILSYFFNKIGIGCYTLSGDNYPHRIPVYNDAERVRIFRNSAMDGLIGKHEYNFERAQIIRKLQEEGIDSDKESVQQYPWLSAYQEAGRRGLENYLGTPNEIDFDKLSGIISDFKEGESCIFLKRMGRKDTELWYDEIDFKGTNVMIVEWTHGNSDNLKGVDIPILLNSTPAETLAHRKSRNRDGATDSSFTTMVLEIEQGLLISQAQKAKIIISKNNEILSYNDFIKLMSA